MSIRFHCYTPLLLSLLVVLLLLSLLVLLLLPLPNVIGVATIVRPPFTFHPAPATPIDTDAINSTFHTPHAATVPAPVPVPVPCVVCATETVKGESCKPHGCNTRRRLSHTVAAAAAATYGRNRCNWHRERGWGDVAGLQGVGVPHLAACI